MKGEGCKAAGYRLAATDGGDFPLCCRHLANDWRMHTLFAKDHSVIVISLARHDKGHNQHQILAGVFPGLSPSSPSPFACIAETSPPPMGGGQASLAAAVFLAVLVLELRGPLVVAAGSTRVRRRRIVEVAPTLSETLSPGNAARISRRPPRASM